MIDFDLIPISEIERDENQPRIEFLPEPLKELSESIARSGVLQPILLRKPPGSEKYIIISGERRWRSAKLAGLTHIPATVSAEFEDPDERLLAQLAENVQRKNLNDDEILISISKLVDDGMRKTDIASRLGKSSGYISKILATRDPSLLEYLDAVGNSPNNLSEFKSIPPEDRDILKRYYEQHLMPRNLNFTTEDLRKVKKALAVSGSLVSVDIDAVLRSTRDQMTAKEKAAKQPRVPAVNANIAREYSAPVAAPAAPIIAPLPQKYSRETEPDFDFEAAVNSAGIAFQTLDPVQQEFKDQAPMEAPKWRDEPDYSSLSQATLFAAEKHLKLNLELKDSAVRVLGLLSKDTEVRAAVQIRLTDDQARELLGKLGGDSLIENSDLRLTLTRALMLYSS